MINKRFIQVMNEPSAIETMDCGRQEQEERLREIEKKKRNKIESTKLSFAMITILDGDDALHAFFPIHLLYCLRFSSPPPPFSSSSISSLLSSISFRFKIN